MTSDRIAILLAAALVAAPFRPALAQDIEQAPAKPVAKPGKAHARAATKRPPKPVAADTGRSPILGPDPAGEDRASSLERRRKAFFAPQPDGGGAATEGTQPRAGVTLGGSNGLTPGMGFSF